MIDQKKIDEKKKDKKDELLFLALLMLAINHYQEQGYTSETDLKRWVKILKESAEKTVKSPIKLEKDTKSALNGTYKRLITQKGALKRHKGINKSTLDKYALAFKKELDRRILASQNIIQLHRETAINDTLRNFQGWATSIPPGGSQAVDKIEERTRIKKALVSLPILVSNVIHDQEHKLSTVIHELIAEKGGAIAMVWHSMWRLPGYNYRPDHKEKDEQVYLLKDSWARAKGLVAGEYYEDDVAVGVLPNCKCFAEWIYDVTDLPTELLTSKGQEWIAQKAK